MNTEDDHNETENRVPTKRSGAWRLSDVFRLSKSYSSVKDNSLKWDYSILSPYLQSILSIYLFAVIGQFFTFVVFYLTGVDPELTVYGLLAGFFVCLVAAFCWYYIGHYQRVYAFGHIAIICMLGNSLIIIFFVSNGLAYHYFAVYNKYISLLLITFVGAMVFNPRLILGVTCFHMIVLSWSTYVVLQDTAQWMDHNLFYLTVFGSGYVVGLVVEDLFEGRNLLNSIQVHRDVMHNVKGEAVNAVLKHAQASLIICDEYGRHIFNSSHPPFPRELIYRLDPFLQTISHSPQEMEEGLKAVDFEVTSPIYRDAQTGLLSAVCLYKTHGHYLISFGVLPDGGRFFFARSLGDSDLSHSLSFIDSYKEAGRVWFSRTGEFLWALGLDIVQILDLPRQSPDFSTLEKGLNLGANQSVEVGKYFEFQRGGSRYIGVIHLVSEGFILDFWRISQSLSAAERVNADTLFDKS